jgi:hypothetical protein
VLHAADRSFKKLLSNIVEAITFADSKLLKTLWLNLSKPGFVSKEFIDGKTVNYMKPLSLFFVLNLIYFFFPVIQLFNASLNTQLASPLRSLPALSKFFQHVVATKTIALGIDLSSFSLIYNLKTVGFAKLMVMVFVVIGSLPLNLLYRKHNRYFADHVSYMVELACFNLFVNAIVLSVFAAFLGVGKYLNELTLTIIFITTNFYFLVRSGQEFYNERGWRLIVKSMLMIVVLKVALELYRLILFFVTIWSI